LKESFELIGHTNYVIDMVFTPDGKKLISAGMDNKIVIWDTETWEKITTLEGHTKSVNSIALSSNGQKVVSGSTDKTLKLWDFSTYEEIQTLKGHKHTVSAVIVSPNDEYIVSGSYDKSVILWSLETGEEIVSKKTGRARPRFSPKGELFIGGEGGKVSMLKLTELDLVTDFQAHEAYVMDFMFTNKGNSLVTSGYDNKIKIWDTHRWNEEKIIDIQPKGGVYSLAISPDDKDIALTRDHQLNIYSLETGDLLREYKVKPKGNYCVKFSPKNKWLLLGSADKKIRVWST
jgi:WD40 repeat protein